MIIASILVFIAILRIILSKTQFTAEKRKILALSFFVVIIGMLFAKMGVKIGIPWWIYYTVPALATMLVPPLALKLNVRRTFAYLLLSFAAAPIIHATFSFLFGWNEYIPFWSIPYWKSLLCV